MTEPASTEPGLWQRLKARLDRHKRAAAIVAAACTGATAIVQFGNSAYETGRAALGLVNPEAPIVLALSQRETQTLNGHELLDVPGLGKVYTAGARARLTLQSKHSDQVVQIDRLIVEVRKKPVPPGGLDYKVDPLRQPGFGDAQVRQVIVVFEDEKEGSSAFRDGDRTVMAAFPNLVPSDQGRVLRLDRNAGLQEAFDVTLAPANPGLYDVRFKAMVTVGGKESAVSTPPLLIFKK